MTGTDDAMNDAPETDREVKADTLPETEGQGLDEERLAALEEELATAKQEVLYAHAETQNVRRRLEKELSDARAYAATAFAREVLSVGDNLERALAAIPADLRSDERFKGLVSGLDATIKEMENVMRKNGVERFESIGQPLDPNRHQAMVEIPHGEAEPGTIVQEMQPGYMIRDRLLRPALVGVAKAPE
jgi:molecular chaperone GrpE